jgi:hypothetical protein
MIVIFNENDNGIKKNFHQQFYLSNSRHNFYQWNLTQRFSISLFLIFSIQTLTLISSNFQHSPLKIQPPNLSVPTQPPSFHSVSCQASIHQIKKLIYFCFHLKVSKIFTEMTREMNRSREKFCSAEKEEKSYVFFS